MRLHDSDHDSISLDSGPEAGPSSAAATSNGHNGIVAKSNGFALPFTNGTSTNGASKAYMPDGAHDHAAERGGAQHIARVSLPGSTLYDDSYVDREEFVRLVIQSLRDVGYIESAATLEAESGYTMEMPEVSEFRRCILDASWDRADVALMRLGVADDERLWEARFLISQQKYLELLEAHKTTAALHVLRNELAPMNVDPDQLHSLSSLIMCSDADDLRQRAGWDGAAGTSRRRLLVNLQQYIPSSVMIPQRRFSTLLDQARTWQQSQCLYHNAPLNSRTFSLYTNHHCDRNAFPQVTTAILEGHTNEVWNLEWSHSGHYLASTSRDNSAIIWRIEFDRNPSERMYRAEHILGDHPFPVGCASWSLDDSILLTAAEHFIKMWNTRTGACIRTMDTHSDHVTSLVWLPDNSGFISGGLDRKIILWDVEGKQRDTWGITPIRVTDLVLTPDCTRLVAIGMYDLPHPPSSRSADTGTPSQGSPAHDEPLEARIIVYDLATKQLETSIQIEGELTSVKVTQDSQYVLVNKSGRTTTTSLPSSPDARGPKTEVCLWDLNTERIVRKYKGHRQKQEVIRSCFGGIDGSFVVSGSEDGNVYVWHRDSGTLLEVLSGHGAGSVNTVAWHPRNERMFASCSDDKTIRIWEAPPGGAHGTPADVSEHPSRDEGKGKGKNRERWDHTGHGAALG